MVATWQVQKCCGNDGPITYWNGFLKCNKQLVRGEWLGDHFWKSTHDHCWAHWRRYMHQVSLAALIKLARQAFEAQNDYLDFSDWKRHHCSQSTTVSYRFTVIHLEVWLFMFIHSLREGDFPLFITSLEIFVPWMFSLHDIHYARWLPVFLEQLKKHEEGTPWNSSGKGIS